MSKSIPAKTTMHHPVAESLLGDYSHAINADEHDSYHRACSFYTPDMLLRRLVYSGFRRNAKSIQLDTAHEMLRVLTPLDWRELYRDGTFISDERRQKKPEADAVAAYHLTRFFTEEQQEISNAIGRVAGFESDNGSMRGMHMFFRTNKTMLTAWRFLSDKQGEKRKWVEPIREHTLEQLGNLTKVNECDKLTKGVRREIIDLLGVQSIRISQYHADALRRIQAHDSDLAAIGMRKGKVDMAAKFD